MTFDTKKLGSWKTTVIGLAGAIVLAVYPMLQGGKPTREQLLLAALTAAAGWVAKDSNVTGGTIPNPSNAPAVVAATSSPAAPEAPHAAP